MRLTKGVTISLLSGSGALLILIWASALFYQEQSSKERKRDLWASARQSFDEGHYLDAHKALHQYIAEFDPTGKDEDDPYILKMAGECLYQLSRKKPHTENRVSELKEARTLFVRAMSIMNHRRQTDPKTSERMFWAWGYRWCQINLHLGREGEQNAYRNVCWFVEENKSFAMGGPAMKKYYLDIGSQACAKIRATTTQQTSERTDGG